MGGARCCVHFQPVPLLQVKGPQTTEGHAGLRPVRAWAVMPPHWAQTSPGSGINNTYSPLSPLLSTGDRSLPGPPEHVPATLCTTADCHLQPGDSHALGNTS